MELKYMERLKNNLSDGFRGLTLEQITELEETFCPPNKMFPKAFREFLALSGAYCKYFGTGAYCKKESDNVLDDQNYYRYEISLVPYDFLPYFFGFGSKQEMSVFYFINLSEELEDPKVYLTSLYHTNDATGVPGFFQRDTGYTFSGFVNGCIDECIKYGNVDYRFLA